MWVELNARHEVDPTWKEETTEAKNATLDRTEWKQTVAALCSTGNEEE